MTTLSYVVELEPKLWLPTYLSVYSRGEFVGMKKLTYYASMMNLKESSNLEMKFLLPSKSILGSSVYCSSIHAPFYISYKS
ncbi:hypothetical protein KSP39_PZI018737 [Platanthera zijinensis]|uniref:Uncharacterized protein n=1 Tax=Platanthera zijinensis TaxID=2320716 RepID=A0AAP0B3H8_9ASPA